MSPEDRAARIKFDGSVVSATNNKSIKEADFLTLYTAESFALRKFTARTRRVDWCNFCRKQMLFELLQSKSSQIRISQELKESPAGRHAQTTPKLIHLCPV